jgi:bile acid:Na+ symporter, BASS family
MLETIDQIQLNFSPMGLMALNVILAAIMFGVALDIRPSDFRQLLRSPKGPLVAVGTQVLIVPPLTFLLTLILDPLPSIALGMILVAACPSGNLSNFLTHLSGGNTPLSIGATALSTVTALVITPINFVFWASLNPNTAPLLRTVQLDPVDILSTVGLVLILPLIVGMTVATHFPKHAARLRKPMRRISIAFFAFFIMAAAGANQGEFTSYVTLVLLAVFLQNALALATGYGMARLAQLSEGDIRAVTIEVGVQNSGLALVLIFNFFEGSGGMALLAAWWGFWHIITGLSLAWFWARRPVCKPSPEEVIPV